MSDFFKYLFSFLFLAFLFFLFRLLFFVPLQKENSLLKSKFYFFDSSLSDIRVSFASKNKQIQSLISDTSRLYSIILQQKEEIKLLSEFKYKSTYQKLRISTVLDSSKSKTKNTFDTVSNWFSISGSLDSGSIFLERLSFKDDFRFVITESTNKQIKGYIQNLNPFSSIDSVFISHNLDQVDWNWQSFLFGSLVGFALLIASFFL